MLNPRIEDVEGAERREACDEIDALYAEIRELMVRASEESGLEEAIHTRFSRLRELQAQEAEAIQEHYNATRYLAPGRGWRALEEAAEILGDEDSAPHHKSIAR